MLVVKYRFKTINSAHHQQIPTRIENQTVTLF